MYKKFLGKWVLFFILFGFNLFMSLKTSFVSFRYLFWIILSAPLISFIWLVLAYSLKRIYLERRIIHKVEEDDSLEIELEIRNKSLLPIFDVVFEDYLSCASPREKQRFVILGSLKLGSVNKLKYRCFCSQRGRYDLGPITAYFFDPLGMLYFKEVYPVYSELYVYPRTFRIHKFPSLNKGTTPWFGVETARISGDDDEFYGVREYRRGDQLKKIHWLASARKNQLIVKEYQRQSFFRATIMFNLTKEDNVGEGKDCIAEYTIKIVASIARYLANLGVSVEVIAHVGEVVHIPFNKGEEHLEDILRFLTIAQPESRVTLLELFETFHREVLEDSSLIVVMPDKDRVYLPAMLSLGIRNVSLIPIFLISSSFLKERFGPKDMKDYGVEISGVTNLNPIYITRQDHLEEKF